MEATFAFLFSWFRVLLPETARASVALSQDMGQEDSVLPVLPCT